jgi:hypothetical protein
MMKFFIILKKFVKRLQNVELKKVVKKIQDVESPLPPFLKGGSETCTTSLPTFLPEKS